MKIQILTNNTIVKILIFLVAIISSIAWVSHKDKKSTLKLSLALDSNNVQDTLRVNFIGDMRKETITIHHSSNKYTYKSEKNGYQYFYILLFFDHKLSDNEVINIAVFREKHPFGKRKMAFKQMRYNQKLPLVSIHSEKYIWPRYTMRDYWTKDSLGIKADYSFWIPQTKKDSLKYYVEREHWYPVYNIP